MSEETANDNNSREKLREQRHERISSHEAADIYGITTWSVETTLDRFCVKAYSSLSSAKGLALVLGGVILFSVMVLSFGLGLVVSPILSGFVVASVVPAFFIAWYVWESDPYRKEPFLLLTVTFLLSCLLTAAPLVINSVSEGVFKAVPVIGTALYFYLVVAPVEEFVKWLAIKLYAYDSDEFRTAVDGAVYGAFAGLGFALVENSLNQLLMGGVGGGVETMIARGGVAPGHVLWSAIAGYYLGLSKVNEEDAGPIAFKGLFIAVVLHATYNTGITYIPGIAEFLGNPEITHRILLATLILSIYGFSGYYLVKKIRKHRKLCDKRVGEFDFRSLIG